MYYVNIINYCYIPIRFFSSQLKHILPNHTHCDINYFHKFFLNALSLTHALAHVLPSLLSLHCLHVFTHTPSIVTSLSPIITIKIFYLQNFTFTVH